MGYHSNEQLIKEMTKDCVRFINDRSRLEYLFRWYMGLNGISNEQIDLIVSLARSCELDDAKSLLCCGANQKTTQ